LALGSAEASPPFVGRSSIEFDATFAALSLFSVAMASPAKLEVAFSLRDQHPIAHHLGHPAVVPWQSAAAGRHCVEP
jgi:hypothetical protein